MLIRLAQAIGLVLLLLQAGCESDAPDAGEIAVPGADSQQGMHAIESFDCGGCHTIPGVKDAGGTLGPPLRFWSKRSFIAGNRPNTPANLIEWLLEPHAIEPGTAMPDVGLTEQQARDIAAYLYTLEQE